MRWCGVRLAGARVVLSEEGGTGQVDVLLEVASAAEAMELVLEKDVEKVLREIL